MTAVSEKNTAIPFKERIYTSQFANYAHRLEREHSIYRENIIAWENRLEKEWKDLQTDQDTLDASGLTRPMGRSIIERGFENINIQRSEIRGRKEEMKLKIEPLLRQLIDFWPDILQAFEWAHIKHIHFAVYLRKYRGLLHEGQSFGLTCYSTPEVQKIKKYLTDNYKLI